VLFETFQVWQDNDASINNTAQRLFCHPNTERHRLRRIEKRSAGPSRSQEISPNHA
jgi:DNA-binding PucR family transcriptional regulator